MKFESVKLPLIILSASALVVFLLVLFKPEPPRKPVEIKPLIVDVVEVKRKALPVSIGAQGVVSPRIHTSMISEVSGRVISVSDKFVVGGFFERGEVLLKIDDTDYIVKLRQVEAAVALARSKLAQEKGFSKVALIEWERRHNRDSLDSPARDLALRKPQIEEAKAQLASTLAQLDQAKSNLQKTQFTAPYRGLVKSKSVDISQYVAAGSEVAQTFAIDIAEIRLPVGESKLPYLDLPDDFAANSSLINAAVILTHTVDEETYTHQAYLTRTEGVLDAGSRSLYLVAQVPDPYGLESKRGNSSMLRVGTFVNAQIQGKIIPKLVELPRNILRPGNNIWVVDSQNRLQLRKISVLRTGGEKMLVSSGLDDGDLVSLTSVGPVLSGTPVRIGSISSQQDASMLGSETNTRPNPIVKDISTAPLGGV
jgi:RND family efflux transporter MFP subunit|tara:strand:- start:28090 stop:29361 length:1272 start_codon:yes stop_codon:yes gene_type:complete